MAKYPGLVRRGKRGTYWFRKRIPRDLNAQLGMGPEIMKSLRTRDFDEAVTLWAREDQAARELFACARAPSKRNSANSAIAVADVVREFELDVRAQEYLYRFELGKGYTDQTSDEDWLKLAEHYRSRLRAKVTAAKARAITLNGRSVVRWLRKNFPGYSFGPDDTPLYRALMRADIRVLEAMLADDPDLFGSTPEPAQQKADSTPLLSMYCASYIERRGEGLSAERADTIRAAVRDLTEVVGR